MTGLKKAQQWQLPYICHSTNITRFPNSIKSNCENFLLDVMHPVFLRCFIVELLGIFFPLSSKALTTVH